MKISKNASSPKLFVSGGAMQCQCTCYCGEQCVQQSRNDRCLCQTGCLFFLANWKFQNESLNLREREREYHCRFRIWGRLPWLPFELLPKKDWKNRLSTFKMQIMREISVCWMIKICCIQLWNSFDWSSLLAGWISNDSSGRCDPPCRSWIKLVFWQLYEVYFWSSFL